MRCTTFCLALCVLSCVAVPSRGEDRGYIPSTLRIVCAADPSTCVPDSVGQEIVLAIWQEQGTIGTVSGAQFGLAFLNDEPVELIPINGFTNLGTMTSPILISPAAEDCNPPPSRALAELRVRLLDPTAYRVCFAASDQDSVSCSMLCPGGVYVQSQLAHYRWGNLPNCPNSGGLAGCLDPLPVQAETWGRTKSRYRN